MSSNSSSSPVVDWSRMLGGNLLALVSLVLTYLSKWTIQVADFIRTRPEGQRALLQAAVWIVGLLAIIYLPRVVLLVAVPAAMFLCQPTATRRQQIFRMADRSKRWLEVTTQRV